jgi:hypothetical protein
VFTGLERSLKVVCNFAEKNLPASEMKSLFIHL